MTESVENGSSKTTEVKKIVKNATDLQRLKLERLMKNPVSVKNGFIILYLLKTELLNTWDHWYDNSV